MKVLFSIIAISLVIGVMSSCQKSDEAVDRTCKVAFITNLTNTAGDTVFVEVEAGQMVNAPVITRTGFKFDGWFTNSADANPDPTKTPAVTKFKAYDVAVKPIYLDMILYARWIK
jgi:hypothetical protein